MAFAPGDFPDLYLVLQEFERTREGDVAEAVVRELAPLVERVVAGQTVAIAVGSRQISRLDEIVRLAVSLIRSRGGEPFIVPAMGSHGGATAQGQLAVLRDVNRVTEQSAACEIRSSLEVKEMGRTSSGFAVFTDAVAADADWVLVINRVKPHTLFTAPIESGLCKMLVIGLGNQKGASSIHHHSLRHDLGDTIVEAAQILVESDRPRLLAGLAIVENAYKELARIRSVPMDVFEVVLREETLLLKDAYRLMPSLPAEAIDLLVVDEIGKDISGSGMDTTIIGRKPGRAGPQISTIYARATTAATAGNAIGMGYADVVHQDVADALDPQSTYINGITARRLPEVKLPLVAATDLQALQILATYETERNPASLRLAWIRSTLHLERVRISAALIDSLPPRGEIIAGPHRLGFTPGGRATIADDAW
jgi:hypothetical protein